MIKKFFKLENILNIVTVIILLVLPYYLFDGKLFIGGDDTRLFYIYPQEFIRNISFFSWHNVSTVGINSQDQFLFPFLIFWSLLDFIIPTKIALSYFAFSLPIIIGLIFFQKSVNELFFLKGKNNIEIYLGSIFYVFSPIIIFDQYFIFLTTIWLVGLIPLILFLFLRYLKTSNFKFVILAAFSCIIFSGALFSIPWILGFLLPLGIGLLICTFLYKKNQVIFLVKKSLIFFIFIFLTQSYWLISFVLSYFVTDSNSFAQKFVSKSFVDTFSPTVLATATGNVFYPLLNLFHRQIAFDFTWKLKDIFLNFYDKTLFINFIYLVVIFLGLTSFRKFFGTREQKVVVIFVLGFLFSLYFFTVNIGPFKDLFLLLGKLPGFLMFRNFYDKFSLGYIINYAILVTICLVIIRRKFKKYNLIFFIFFAAIVINVLPIKDTINSPLWTTKDIHRVIKIPDEYLSFMAQINKKISPTNTILNLPFGTSIYSVIKDEDSNNVYVGTSPVRIFSGVNDISGHYSFNFTEEADKIDLLFLSSDRNKIYNELNNILYTHNINYVMVTKNIPKQVLNSWVFDKRMLVVQDQIMVDKITSKRIFTSKNGNYELYESTRKNSLINSKNIYFKKISPVKYSIYIHNIKDKQALNFLDSYHSGWKLYINQNPNKIWCEFLLNGSLSECSSSDKLFDKDDLLYSLKSDIFESSHKEINNFANEWTIDPNLIKKKYTNKFYKLNSDGSIDIELVLYFLPQNYFYIGSIVSLLILLFGLFYYVKKSK